MTNDAKVDSPVEGSTIDRTVGVSNPHDDHHLRVRVSRWGVAVVILVIILALGIPWVHHLLTTVSTDDAYVNGHLTFVAPRVGGQVLRVLVDDNYRVKKGDLLVQLDKEP